MRIALHAQTRQEPYPHSWLLAEAVGAGLADGFDPT
jgi:hypothetical protein